MLFLEGATAATTTKFVLSGGATTGIIDPSNTHGAKLYECATAALPTTFDCGAGNLKVFVAELADRASVYG